MVGREKEEDEGVEDERTDEILFARVVRLGMMELRRDLNANEANDREEAMNERGEIRRMEIADGRGELNKLLKRIDGKGWDRHSVHERSIVLQSWEDIVGECWKVQI